MYFEIRDNTEYSSNMVICIFWRYNDHWDAFNALSTSADNQTFANACFDIKIGMINPVLFSLVII